MNGSCMGILVGGAGENILNGSGSGPFWKLVKMEAVFGHLSCLGCHSGRDNMHDMEFHSRTDIPSMTAIRELPTAGFWDLAATFKSLVCYGPADILLLPRKSRRQYLRLLVLF